MCSVILQVKCVMRSTNTIISSDPDTFSSGMGRWVSVTFLASTSVSNEVSQVRSTESDGRVSYTF